ncbi:MAG: hypothetical protein GY851_20270 [bacterium]|nr:hypothetical protein [bacterium]
MSAIASILLALTPFTAVTEWKYDFERQPLDERPRLEVRYTDGSRGAFEIVAEDYGLTGELGAPHRLIDTETGRPWLWFEIDDANGTMYSSQRVKKPSRINLYRRGPYFCEVHWFDIQLADEHGNLAPLKGDLALYCYPDKILASITWHGTGAFTAGTMRALGISPAAFEPEPFKEGSKQTFAFPLFGETTPLPDAAFESTVCKRPMRYDPVRGCYTIGSLSEGGFQGHFYDHPNRYETASFTVTNPGRDRTIYICHENIGGDKGTVEGGVLLDEDGHPLPMLVQISKNFAGEKEEKFYNPADTSFSETYFPLRLRGKETRSLTSLHLYQNWGRHMVKQFSSLGAWMDYFHSSTGVTETTCYVPFKFGALPGVDIADLRAYSQETFWGGQPQHDNIAGHSFLSYKADGEWQYLVYRGTTYRSTGPNWMDIGFEYVSTDGKIKATVDTFELPQADELRNFIHVRYEALEPLTVANAMEDFRLLTVAAWVQSLRYTHFAATGIDDIELTFDKNNFGARGVPLPKCAGFLAVHGEPKGSNAIILRRWEAPVRPAASALCEKGGNTRLLLVPGTDTISLNRGDVIEFDAIWMPYGEVNGAVTPRRETTVYASDPPRVVKVSKGSRVSDFPPTVYTSRNWAEFTLQGGRDLVPVIVTGLKDYRWPRIYRKESGDWRLLSHSRVGDLDGVQVFSDGRDRFGAVFLVHSDRRSQDLRVLVGRKDDDEGRRIAVKPLTSRSDRLKHAALIQAPWMDAPIQFRFPETVNTDTLDFIDHARADMPARVDPAPLAKVWETTEGDSLCFEWAYDNQTVGGRISPNEDDVDLEFWLANGRKDTVSVAAQFCPVLAGTMFDDPELTRTWIFSAGRWVKMSDTNRGEGDPELCHYSVAGSPQIEPGAPWGAGDAVADLGLVAVTSEDGDHVFAIAWPDARSILSNAKIPCVHADPVLPDCPPGRRVHVRGKLYLMEGTLNDVAARARREITPLSKCPSLW